MIALDGEWVRIRGHVRMIIPEPRAEAVAARPAVAVSGLVKQYGDVAAVKGIAFEVQPGECFGLLGPNGAGKSTTIRMLCCLAAITAGSIEVFGLPAYPGNAAIKRQIGVVSQDDNLDPDLTVLENVEMQGRFYGQSAAEARARAIDLLTWMQLDSKRGAQVRDLSGGMRRRLVIARALMGQPRLLVLDEPTTGLDPQARQLVWAKIRELGSEGVTVLLTTHYMDEAERLADRLVIMDHGEVLERGTPRDVIERVVGHECLEFDGLDPRIARRMAAEAAEAGRRHDEWRGDTWVVFADDVDALLRRWQKTGDIPHFYRRRAGLEDVFLRLTGRDLRE